MKNTLRFFSLLMIFLIAFSLSGFAAFADGDLVEIVDGTTAPEVIALNDDTAQIAEPVDPSLPRVIDNADLLTDSQESALAEKIADLTSRRGFDVAILTTNDTDGKDIMDYADDYYDHNGYGCGDSRDGLIYVLDMGGREWWISTCGHAIDVFTDYGIQEIGGKIGDDLSDGNYYDAFDEFIDLCDDYAEEEENGQAVDTWIPDPEVETERSVSPFPYIISLGIGLVVALIVTGSMKKKLNTAVPQKRADQYMRKNSFELMASEDTFLYSNVVATPRHVDDDRTSGGGHFGGSSTHTSSSGSTHGGGGVHF